MKRSALRLGAIAALLLAALAGAVAWLNLRGEAPLDAAPAAPVTAEPATIARGAYLALAGNCAGCHTARGGAAYAGGRTLETPFGDVFTSNLTPDRDTGIGAWTPAEFWRALHNGRSRDGRLLLPAFPYPNYTLVTRADADAIFAWLRTLPAVRQPNRPHALRFPYDQQASLAVWRALYFRPETFAVDAARPADWNRGRYLVRGLGHCEACHAGRNRWGASRGGSELAGGMIPQQNWYAPSLASPSEAGVAGWAPGEVVALLKTGIAPRASVMGPMAEVVFRSTQHLHDDDLAAIAAYLRALPQTEPAADAARPEPAADPARPVPAGDAARPAPAAAERDAQDLGTRLYATHCADCHGRDGQGVAGAYPALAGNRAVLLQSPNNVVKAVLHGGFAPATAGNPRPYGMPPFEQALSEAEIAAVTTHVRQSWGNHAPAVTPLDARRAR